MNWRMMLHNRVYVIDDDFEVKMTFFMRLSTNKNAFPLGGDVTPNICYTDYPGQQQAIETFINSAEVRARLFQFGVISNQNACFAIKSVEDAVDDPYGAINDGEVHYSIADFILAIDEKSFCP